MPKHIDIEDLLIWAFRDERVETNAGASVDALTIYWAVKALPDPHGQLIRHCARIGRQPVWRPDPEVRVVHLGVIRAWRERYGNWYRTLTLLQRTLNGALRDHVASGPQQPEQPWREARAAASGIARRAL